VNRKEEGPKAQENINRIVFQGVFRSQFLTHFRDQNRDLRANIIYR